MTEEGDVEFITEEKFDFGFLSPSDSREEDCLDGEEEEEEDGPAGVPPARDSGRWSPLSGAKLEEMVKEANQLAVQLEQCRLPRREPVGTPASPRLLPAPGGSSRSPRSPRRETFVVKNSPVRALLPTVEPGAPTGTAPAPARSRAKAAARAGAGNHLAKKAPGTRKDPAGCRPTPAPKGPPVARVPPSRVAPGRPCPPQGSGAACRGKSEPPRVGAAGQVKAGGGAAPSPPAASKPPPSPAARQPRARAATATAATNRPPAPSAIPKPPGRTAAPGSAPAPAPAGKGAPRASAAAQRGPVAVVAAVAAARVASGAGCRPGPPASRLRPPRKTALASSSR